MPKKQEKRHIITVHAKNRKKLFLLFFLLFYMKRLVGAGLTSCGALNIVSPPPSAQPQLWMVVMRMLKILILNMRIFDMKILNKKILIMKIMNKKILNMGIFDMKIWNTLILNMKILNMKNLH